MGGDGEWRIHGGDRPRPYCYCMCYFSPWMLVIRAGMIRVILVDKQPYCDSGNDVCFSGVLAKTRA
jgi:hypothetical protein